jgi:hypothetical protein
MTQTQFRKRVGSKASTGRAPNDGDRILDEQGTATCAAPRNSRLISYFGGPEQDEVIDDIRHQILKSDREHQVGIGVIALLSCVL